jgi:hypothetical protein
MIKFVTKFYMLHKQYVHVHSLYEDKEKYICICFIEEKKDLYWKLSVYMFFFSKCVHTIFCQLERYRPCICVFDPTVLQAPYNTLVYTLVGEDPGPLYFQVGVNDGRITLRSSLYQDTVNNQYRVSKSSGYVKKVMEVNCHIRFSVVYCTFLNMLEKHYM